MRDGYEATADGGPDLIGEQIESYLNDTKARLAELRTALNDQDSRAAQLIAQCLKGSSSNLGVRGIVALCSKLETQFRNEASEGAGAVATLAHLEDEFERVQQAFAAELQLV